MDDTRLASFILIVGVLGMAYWLWQHPHVRPGAAGSAPPAGEGGVSVVPGRTPVPTASGADLAAAGGPPPATQSGSIPTAPWTGSGPPPGETHIPHWHSLQPLSPALDMITPEGGNLP